MGAAEAAAKIEEEKEDAGEEEEAAGGGKKRRRAVSRTWAPRGFGRPDLRGFPSLLMEHQ